MLHIGKCWSESNRKKQCMQSIYDLPQYKPQFPSSSMAFLSGGSGNLVYQSIRNGWTLWTHRNAQGKRCPAVKLSLTNVVYAGLITTSYMLYNPLSHSHSVALSRSSDAATFHFPPDCQDAISGATVLEWRPSRFCFSVICMADLSIPQSPSKEQVVFSAPGYSPYVRWSWCNKRDMTISVSCAIPFSLPRYSSFSEPALSQESGRSSLSSLLFLFKQQTS